MDVTHLYADPMPPSQRSLCGIKRPTPVVSVRWAAAHDASYGLHVCPACIAAVEAIVAAITDGSSTPR